LFCFGYINFFAFNLNPTVFATVIQAVLLSTFFKKPDKPKTPVSPGASVQRQKNVADFTPFFEFIPDVAVFHLTRDLVDHDTVKIVGVWSLSV
jgi:hypothetical protein